MIQNNKEIDSTVANNKNKLISIAMTTYNGEKFIAQQLDSILSQSHSNLEITICDDGSTDSTPTILKKYSHEDNRIKLFFNESNLGLIKNFEKAISLCQGEYIALSDQDDLWEPKKIEILLSRLNSMQDAGYVFSDAYIVNETLQQKGYTLWESKRFSVHADRFNKYSHTQTEILLKYSIVFGMSMMFKSMLKEFILPFSTNFSHDNWISLISSSIGFRGYAIKQPLIHYRQHEKQICGTKKFNIINSIATVSSIYPENYSKELDAYQDLKKRLLLIAENLKNITIESAIKALNEKNFHLEQRTIIRNTKGSLKSKLITKEIFTMRYFLFSNGIKSIIRDFVAKYNT